MIKSDLFNSILIHLVGPMQPLRPAPDFTIQFNSNEVSFKFDLIVTSAKARALEMDMDNHKERSLRFPTETICLDGGD